MINKLASRKYWEIAAIYLSVTVSAILLLMFAVRWLNGTWPQTGSAALVLYIVLAAAISWATAAIATEAVLRKYKLAKANAALDELLDMIANYDAEDAEATRG